VPVAAVGTYAFARPLRTALTLTTPRTLRKAAQAVPPLTLFPPPFASDIAACQCNALVLFLSGLLLAVAHVAAHAAVVAARDL